MMEKKKRKNKLKLFVWENFNPDYTRGLAFAIARDETGARKLVVNERGFEPCEWGDLTVYPLMRIRAKSVSGGG